MIFAEFMYEQSKDTTNLLSSGIRQYSTFHGYFDGTIYRTSTCLPLQSSFNLLSTNSSRSRTFVMLIPTIRITSAKSSGMPPAFCTTHSSRCALSAMVSVPSLSVCSSLEGSRIAVDAVDVEVVLVADTFGSGMAK